MYVRNVSAAEPGFASGARELSMPRFVTAVMMLMGLLASGATVWLFTGGDAPKRPRSTSSAAVAAVAVVPAAVAPVKAPEAPVVSKPSPKPEEKEVARKEAAPVEPIPVPPAPKETGDPKDEKNRIQWMEDLEEAKAVAAREKKDLFVYFNGSDWCGYCIKLNNESIDIPAFAKKNKKNFVFVNLDMPRQKPISKEVQEKRERLSLKYGVQGFPVVLLMDPAGIPYAMTGYEPTKVGEVYAEHVDELRKVREKRDEFMKDVDTLQGEVKAKRIIDVIQMLFAGSRPGLWVVEANRDRLLEVIKSVPPSKAALHEPAAGLLVEYVWETRFLGEFDNNITLLNKMLENELSTEIKQIAYFYRGQFELISGKTDAGLASLDQAQKTAPESENGKRIEQMIVQIKAKLQEQKDALNAPPAPAAPTTPAPAATDKAPQAPAAPAPATPTAPSTPATPPTPSTPGATGAPATPAPAAPAAEKAPEVPAK